MKRRENSFSAYQESTRYPVALAAFFTFFLYGFSPFLRKLAINTLRHKATALSRRRLAVVFGAQCLTTIFSLALWPRLHKLKEMEIVPNKRRKAKTPRVSFAFEWVGVTGAQKMFDLGETAIYTLIREGKIRSKLVVLGGRSKDAHLSRECHFSKLSAKARSVFTSDYRNGLKKSAELVEFQI